MGLEFRRRDYRAEEQVHSLPRTRVEIHPLAVSSPLPLQVEESAGGKDDFFDPLRATDGKMEALIDNIYPEYVNSEATFSNDMSSQFRVKEWISFKKLLMQKFPVSKTIPISMMTSLFVKNNKGSEKLSKDLHLAELDERQKGVEDIKGISQQEYASRLHELKNEIKQAWHADDQITSLRLSIKVARLLMDTSVIQLYPSLFILVTDIMDMLGDLVWNRIKHKAEFTKEGGFICSLPDDFQEADLCSEAKETCNNWFCKIGSVYELLPRIYLELAILPCWRFLVDHHEDILQRLVLMTRGITDPLASAYCRLYLVQCSQRLRRHDTGYLITCINDLNVILRRAMSLNDATYGNLSGNSKLLFTLIEPTIEYITRCLFKDLKQMEVDNVLVTLGMGINPSVLIENCSCISIILHYILKELPIGFTCFNAAEMLHLIECTDDCSFDQCLNFKLLGFRLCERIPEVNKVHLVVDKIIQVLSRYDSFDAYLMVADAYLEIIFENQLDTFPKVILDGIFERAREEIGEIPMVTLQSILLKFLTHFENIEDILVLNHFIDIVDMMHGSSRNSINMHILSMATRNSCIRDPTIIEVLFEVAQAFHDGIDFSNMKTDDYQNSARVICRFIFMVDYGTEVESHLQFLAQCRGAFATISELQEMLVHSSNNLAVRSMSYANSNLSFVKSCLSFNEVTIPCIHTNLRRLNFYLETAEVALLGGFISHLYELLDAAVNCLENVHSVDAGLQMHEDVDRIVSLMCKLCGMLVIVPGSLERGVTCIPNHVLSFLDSNSWILPRMKIKVLSAIVFLSAALSQNPLLYHVVSLEDMGNDRLFFGVPAYPQELLSLTGSVLQGIVNIALQEPALAVRGRIALETCNCIASSFMTSNETLETCSKLVDIAKSCLSAEDKFLQSTLKFLDARQFHL